MPKKHDSLLLLILLVSLAVYLWEFDFFQVGTYRDDAQYIVMAKSLVEEDGGNRLGGQPGSAQTIRYPFQHSAGWPLLLAPIYALSGGDFQALKLLALIFTLANTVLIVKGWQQLGFPSPPFGLAVGALYALSPRIVRHASIVMSEPAFLFFVLVVLILTVRSSSGRRSMLMTAATLGVAWLLSVAVRAAGVTVVVPSIIWLLWRKQFGRAAIALGSLVVALVLIVGTAGINWQDLVGTGEYSQQFENPALWQSPEMTRDLVQRAAGGLVEYATEHLRNSMVAPSYDRSLTSLLGRLHLGFILPLLSVIILALVLLGYLLSILRRPPVPPVLFVPLHMIAIVIWPWRGDRFLYAIIPFLTAYLLIGSVALLSAMGKRLRMEHTKLQTLRLVCLALLLCGQLVQSLRLDNWPDHYPDFRAGTTWIRDNTLSDSTVLAEEQQAVYLYSQRSTAGLGDAAQIRAYAKQTFNTYALIAPQLVWSPSPRQLSYSETTRRLLEQFESGALPGMLVYDDPANLVRVYQVTP